MMAFSGPEWLLRDPGTPGTMMGGGSYADAETWGTMVDGTGSMMGTRSYASSYRAQALEVVTTTAGTFADALHVREQRGSGYTRDVWYARGVGVVMMNDGTQTAVLTGYYDARRCRAAGWRRGADALHALQRTVVEPGRIG